MPSPSRSPRPADQPRPVPPPCTFICTGCECVEHRRTPVLPEGWTTIEARGDILAYCPDCAPAGAVQ
ncbi:hypothetical protein [Novosphingobium colocasiae]|uniref:Uncharacterized protein n=1 Tax=Novosphingobium colocasiae TaxID=1256513 RepID=A0A918PEN1_9SPHN|nr:hypothetical protein [Novosphingobium colocasiae]GGZ02492.1 hypothetical protein GCM10011614_16950 [Novosphingobium colocasiae]